ncbi:hypothetical protein ACPWT1_07960 [Ramlibacter sp. MMS24-I3-19]|uniref:hypothetical protein n=1 Tax=Ramlibacter sp. MMS24-I3-19 TaxID=3416606 RepID=UPI003D05F617
MNKGLRSWRWLVAVSCLSATSLHAQDTHVDVWIRSFIANKHPSLPDYIKRAANGLFVIPAPNLPAPPPLEIARLSGTCFTTDQRDSFSSALDESARIGVYVRIVVKGREITSVTTIDGKPQVVVGPTKNVDCASGVELQPSRKTAADATTITQVVKGEGYRSFSVRISGGDPFYQVLGLPVAPRIDSEILFMYDVATRNLSISGASEDFPWYEAYYRKGAGPTKTIVQRAPVGESTAFSLFDFGTGVNLTNFKLTVNLLAD